MPEVVDRRGQHGQSDPARRQVKPTGAAQAEDPQGSRRRAAVDQASEGVAGQHSKAGEDDDGHPGVGHDVRWDPERVPADPHVPLDVPLHAPSGQKVGAQEDPERDAVEAEGLDAGAGRRGRTPEQRGLHGAHWCFSFVCSRASAGGAPAPRRPPARTAVPGGWGRRQAPRRRKKRAWRR